MLSASVASAAVATAAAGAEPVSKQINFLEVLAKGGLMIFPLGLMSVVMVILIFLFLLTIRRNVIVSDRFMNAAEAMIRKRDYLGLIAYSQRRNECMARITQKTIEFLAGNPSIPFENVREAAQTEGSRQASLLTSRITYLADIGSLAPMIGLLGTVIGMIKAFIEISTGEVQGVRQMGLAQGVSEALIATACGLAVSIVALTFYSFFRGRVQKYIGELEAAATHLVAVLHGQLERQGLQVPSAPAERTRDDYGMPVPLHLGAERADIQGI
ncbi:MAG: MotA/TolQ/ExbB proton channel family protein [Verrucomicrobiota bacterium]